MTDSSATIGGSGWRAITSYQWLVFLVVWAGWTLDAADFGLFSLVLQPAMRDLLGFAATGPLQPAQAAQVGKYGGLLVMTGLLGWAAGGFIFGVLADYIGRVRALMFSIALYSFFTALQGLSIGLVDFGLYRFLAGIGTGAELIVGIPLLAETLGETHRSKIAGIMMTGGAVGTFLGAWANGLVGAYALHLTPPFVTTGGPEKWRTVFFVGVLPALLLMIIRRRILEPGRFSAVQQRRQAVSAGRAVGPDDREFMRFVPVQLFNRDNRYNTFVGLLFALGSLMANWTTVSWLPTILQQLAEKTGMPDPAGVKNHGIMIWSLGGIAGYAAFGFVADLLGRRWTVALYSVGSTAFGLLLYLGLSTYDPWYPVVLPIFGFCVFGVFSGHAVYFPELFPTQIRSTGCRVLQRRGADHHQLRPADRRVAGGRARRVQHRRGDDELLRARLGVRDGHRPRNQGRRAAALTDCAALLPRTRGAEWRNGYGLISVSLRLITNASRRSRKSSTISAKASGRSAPIA